MAGTMMAWAWIPLLFASLSAAQSNDRSFPKGWSPFKTLGMPESDRRPKKSALKKAHREAALLWHPDKCKDFPKKCEKKMQAVNVAHEVLSDKKEFQNWQNHKHGRHRQQGRGGGGGNPFGGGFNPFGGGGNPFGGGGPRQGAPRQQRAKPRPMPKPPPPSPRPKVPEMDWKVVKQVEERRGQSTVTAITREAPLPGGRQVKVELLEKVCYEAMKECTETVIERWRRKKDEL